MSEPATFCDVLMGCSWSPPNEGRLYLYERSEVVKIGHADVARAQGARRRPVGT